MRFDFWPSLPTNFFIFQGSPPTFLIITLKILPQMTPNAKWGGGGQKEKEKYGGEREGVGKEKIRSLNQYKHV